MKSGHANNARRRGEPPVWLLTLTLPDGHRIRTATAEITIATRTTPTDGPYQYHPLLSGVSEFDEELDLTGLDGVGTLTQARADLVTTTDLANLAGDWLHITAASVEIALIWEGQDWEEREKLLSAASVQGIEWGLAGEVTTLSMEASPPRSSAEVGDDSRDLGDDWPGVVDTGALSMTDLSGSKYQRVYGDPESIPGYKVGDVGGNNRLILAGHRFARTGASYQVTVYEDGVSQGAFTVGNDTVSGEDYAYVESATEFTSPDSGAAGGAYTFSAGFGGIHAVDAVTGAALQAAGVLAKLLEESEVAVDWPAMQPTLEKLTSWRLGFYTDQQAGALDLIRDRLLPYLPLVEMQSGAGLWFAYIDPLHDPIAADLRTGQQLVGRVDRMSTTDPDSIANRLTLRYWLDATTGEYLETATLTADNDALCYVSEQLYGPRSEPVIECDAIWDAATALRVLKSMAARRALPRRRISYQLAGDLHWLRAGRVVRLTDTDHGLSNTRAVITRIRRAATPIEATFELLDRTPMSR